MAYVAVSASPITVRETAGPVDPGFGVGGERPDNSLPGIEGPTDPSWGIELPPVISNELPPYPGHPLPVPPTYPVKPDNSLPRPPHVWPLPPHPVDPDYDRPIPVVPSLPIYMPAPGAPDNSLPLPPATVWPPLPDEITGMVLAFCWIVGVGYRWVAIDADARPEHPIAPPPLYPSHQPVPGGEHPSTQPVPTPPSKPIATP